MAKTRGGLSSRPRCDKNRVTAEEKTNKRGYEKIGSGVPPMKTQKRDLVTAEVSKKREDRMSFGGDLTMKIPRELYDEIVEAVDLRKQLEANPGDLGKLSELISAEGCIEFYAKLYKKHDLPRNWKYDPDIAITLVDTKRLVPLEFQDTVRYGKEALAKRRLPQKPPRWADQIPETSDLPLNEKDEDLWLLFKRSDKKARTPVLESLSMNPSENKPRSLDLELPIVSLIGNFAVDTFNKSYEMVVDDEEKRRIGGSNGCLEFLTCEYIKTVGPYAYGIQFFFYMTIRSVEQGTPGTYETKVVCNFRDGGRSLSRFVRVEPTPTPTLTDEDDSVGEEDISSSESEREDERRDKFLRTGLKRRHKKATCRGYDFYNPLGFDGP